MSRIKIKSFQLFQPADINQLSEPLIKLISFPAKGGGLKYDLSIKLAKAVEKAAKEFQEFRINLLEEMAFEKIIMLKGAEREIKTKFAIIDASKETKDENLIKIVDGDEVKGKKILGSNYDLGAKLAEFQKQINDQLNAEIELDCYPIKLTKLDKEDCSDLDFIALESFISDDRSTGSLIMVN